MVAAHNGWVSPSESLWSLGAEGRWQLTRWRKNIWDEIHYHTQVYIGAEYSSFINLVVHSFKLDVSASLRNSFTFKSTSVKHLLENPKFILLTEDTQVHSILLHWSTCAYIQYHITYSKPLQQVILLMIVTGYPPAVKPLGRIVIIQQYRGLHVHSCDTVALCWVAGRWQYTLADVVAAHVQFPSLFTDHYLMTTMDSCTKLIVKCFIQHCWFI